MRQLGGRCTKKRSTSISFGSQSEIAGYPVPEQVGDQCYIKRDHLRATWCAYAALGENVL